MDTPLQRTRFFLFFGTEFTLIQTLPYCRSCKGSAKRIRLGLGSRVLVWFAVCSALFLALVVTADNLPKVIGDHLFFTSLALSFLLTFGYFWLRTSSSKPWYYQPAAMLGFSVREGAIDQVTIGFYNRKYAKLFADANVEAIEAGMLQVAEMPGAS